MPSVRSVVATGRSMNGADGFMSRAPSFAGRTRGMRPRAPRLDAPRQPIEREVDHRGGEERQQLTQDQPADHGDAQRMPQLGAYRSEEHTSELQSHVNLVCRLLLEKK